MGTPIVFRNQSLCPHFLTKPCPSTPTIHLIPPNPPNSIFLFFFFFFKFLLIHQINIPAILAENFTISHLRKLPPPLEVPPFPAGLLLLLIHPHPSLILLSSFPHLLCSSSSSKKIRFSTSLPSQDRIFT